MIDSYVGVMKMTIDLASTSLDSLLFIEYQLESGYIQETILLLQDFVQAYSQMERSLQPFHDQLPPNEIESLTDEVRTALESLLFAYEKEDAGKAYYFVKESLLPAYVHWKQELEKNITYYIT
jgi:hypothetical protein